jgi:O-antigen/teichoic acid export membrane protein
MTARKFAFDVSWVFLSQIIGLATGFLLRVILGGFLGASPLGLYTMTLTIYIIASVVGGFGIPAAIVKYVAEFKENKEKINIFVSSGVVNSVFFGAIAGTVLFALSNTLANIFNMPELTDLLKIIAFSLPFLLVNNTLLGLLNGLREMKSYSFFAVLRSVFLLFFTILLVYIGLGIKGAVLALGLSEIGTLFLLIFISRNFFHFVIRDYVKTTKEVVKFGSQLFLAGAIWMTNTNADKLLVGYFLMDEDVGIYAIAVVFASVFSRIPGVISTVTYPMMSENYGKKLHQANEILINKTIKYSLAILSILAILLIIFARDIISWLLGPEFLPAVIPLTILVIALIFSGSLVSTGSAFSAAGRPDLTFKINLVMLVPNIALNILLIPLLGITGAAIGTAASLSVGTILGIYLRIKILGLKIDLKCYILSLISIATMIAIFYMFQKWINPYLLAGTLFLIYSIVVIKFFFNEEDRKEVRKVLEDFFTTSFK